MNERPVKPQWMNLLKRMQSATRTHDGICMMQMQIIVRDGTPLFWAEPKVVKLEPKQNIGIEMLMEELGEEMLGNVLDYMVKNG